MNTVAYYKALETMLDQGRGKYPGLFSEPSRSIAEAMHKRFLLLGDTFFDNIVAWGYAILIFIGSWIVSLIIPWIVWHLLMFNWRKLFCGGGKKNEALVKKYNDHDESANKPSVVPVPKGTPNSGIRPHENVSSSLNQRKVGTGNHPQLVPLKQPYNGWDFVGEAEQQRAKADEQTHYKVKPVITAPDYNRFSGHKRTRYESYVRLIVLCLRVGIVVVGVILAFQAAGVNILSLIASLGVVSVCFSYGAAPMITNILCAIYMYGTDKIEMGDYVQVANVYGFVTALRAQWSELTDDLSPLHGKRRVHQVPNRLPMETIVTVFPNGPPPAILMQYFKELQQVNEFRMNVLKIDPIEACVPQIAFDD